MKRHTNEKRERERETMEGYRIYNNGLLWKGKRAATLSSQQAPAFLLTSTNRGARGVGGMVNVGGRQVSDTHRKDWPLRLANRPHTHPAEPEVFAYA